MLLGVGFATFGAPKPAQAIAMLAEAGTPDIAIWAVHRDFCFGFGGQIDIIQQSLAVI